MNDWNYTKKAAKISFICALTLIIYLFVDKFYNTVFSGGSIYACNLLPDFILMIQTLMFLILYISMELSTAILGEGLCIFGIPFIFALIGAAFGFLIDLISKYWKRGTDKDQREKGVFIRIPVGGGKKLVISEKVVNYFIIVEFLVLVFFVALNFSGDMYDNSDVTYENEVNGVEGKYERGILSSTILIYFDKNTNTFIENYPDNTTENGTYIVNETLLTLYYSNGTIKEYIIKNVNQLSPANRSQFCSKDEWYDNWYTKPWRMY